MKQPDLGKKITELRKAKGLTQEELVEKCNISVRTIQRIESGEVTPRSYTVKTILAALGHDFKEVTIDDREETAPETSMVGNFFRIDRDAERPAGAMVKMLTTAWIFGIVYFVLGFFEGISEYSRLEGDDVVFGDAAYVAIKLTVLASYIFFMRGFILIGGLYDNYLLRNMAVILIGVNVVLTGYDIASLFYDSDERVFMLPGISFTYGAMGIIFGVALRRLERPLGRVAELAGIFEIAAACFFLSVVLGFIGFIALIPAELFEIILLFKAMETVKAKEMRINVAGQ